MRFDPYGLDWLDTGRELAKGAVVAGVVVGAVVVLGPRNSKDSIPNYLIF
jgi:hypothetical protein